MSGCWCRPVGSAGIIVWRRRSRTIARLMSSNGAHFWRPMKNGKARRAAGAAFFENIFGISDTRDNPKGPYQGLIHLGCTDATLPAWLDMQRHLLQALEHHLEVHDYILGGRPSLGDYALLGPIYVHFYRDPVAGFDLRRAFPFGL